LVLRSKNIFGPYEARKVLVQGKTEINGPHQGAWVDTQTGESWFIHFQDKGAYGRVVHLEPMKWVSDWPVIGIDPDGDGLGEPVLTFKKPNVGRAWPINTPADSDEFNDSVLGRQWQWQANPETNWMFPAAASGFVRLFNVTLPAGYRNFWDVPNLLLQKFPAPEFTATTKVIFTSHAENEKTGLIVMGLDYAYLSIQQKNGALYVSQTICKDADHHTPETEGVPVAVRANQIYLRVTVAKNAVCSFSFSLDGVKFSAVGPPFTARQGKWIGAKVGIFAVGVGTEREMGYADFDWFRLQKESS